VALVNTGEELNDYPFGESFFRELWEDAEFTNRDYSHTNFNRSGMTRVRFAGCCLAESYMCWADFVGCDFSGADLSGCDMRASLFKDCRFDGANVRGADLRRSSFEGCSFTGADMTGAVADEYETMDYLYDKLSAAQLATMSLPQDPGPEPPGG
jgi:BTB/POZ domain-containing protein KCTD9